MSGGQDSSTPAAGESTGAAPAPPLVRLLRQLSSDARAGLVTPQQKQLIKTSILQSAKPPTADPGSADGSGQPSAEPNHEPPAASGAGSSGGARAGAGASDTPLIPLLRQLSACARDGLIDTEHKAHIKVDISSLSALRRFVLISICVLCADRRCC
jgi:hypothetical protein